MKSEWISCALSDVIDIIGGGTPKRSIKEYWGGAINWLSVVDFNSDNKYVSDTAEYITELGLKKSSTRKLSTGQLIISARGTVGALAQLTKPMAFNQSCYGLNANLEFTNNDFLYYLVKHKVSNLQQITHGAVFDTITRETFKHIAIDLPPLPTQKTIAHILSTLDDKIELNRKMNQTLESMAQAIFKSWFVDFDPVHAKAGVSSEDELDKAAKDLGISREVLDLFPSEFEESELGLIPKGWCVSSVGQEFNVTMGQSPPGSTYNEEGVGAIFFQGRTDFGFRYPSNRIYCIEPKRLAYKGDTLVSVRAPVGDVNMAAEDCCIGRGLSAVRHVSGSRSYSYYSMLQLREHFNIFEGEGTVFGSINQKGFKSLRQLKVNGDMVCLFEDFSSPLDEKIQSNSEEIQYLINLLDTLLPKLLSGELDVSNLNLGLTDD